MRASWLLLMSALGLACPPAGARAEPSVRVQLAPVRRGELPDTITAYGAAGPASNALQTLSVLQPGQVGEIAVTPGSVVRAGQRLLRFATAPSAGAAYQQAVSALALARAQRAHTAQLLAEQLATRDQMAQADKALSDAASALSALRREGAGRGDYWLTAPRAGVVAAVPVAVGDRPQPGAPLVSLAAAQGLIVTVGVEPRRIAAVHPGEPVRLQALEGGDVVDGRVLRVDGVLDPRTRLIDVDVTASAGQLLSGQMFRAEIAVGRDRGWLVPHAAVLRDGHGDYLFQVDGRKAVRVAVRLVGSNGATDVVDGPLDPSRPLVVDGAYQLDDGALVRTAGR